MKYSVVIPLYNSHPFIRATLDSVLSQTVADFEVVVIDDGSPNPEGAEIVRSYADPRIRLIVQKNTGLPGARNRGMREARGEYVALLDGDDQWYPFHLQAADEFFAQHPAIGWFTGDLVGVDWGQPIPPQTYRRRFTIRQPYDGVTPGHSSAMVFKRDLMLQVGGFPEDFRQGQEDRIAYARLAKVMPLSGVYDGVSVVYNHHAGSITRGSTNQVSYDYWMSVFGRLRPIGMHPARKYNSSLREVVWFIYMAGLFAKEPCVLRDLLNDVKREVGPLYCCLLKFGLLVRQALLPDCVPVSPDIQRGDLDFMQWFQSRYPTWSWKSRFRYIVREQGMPVRMRLRLLVFTMPMLAQRLLTFVVIKCYRHREEVVTRCMVRALAVSDRDEESAAGGKDAPREGNV